MSASTKKMSEIAKGHFRAPGCCGKSRCLPCAQSCRSTQNCVSVMLASRSCSSSRKVSGLTPTAVFALATPKSPIDRGGRWQLQFCLLCNWFFYFSVILSDTHQGRVWNQTTQPELVTKPWQRQESNPRPLGVVGTCDLVV
jgi:hypothetical protein